MIDFLKSSIGEENVSISKTEEQEDILSTRPPEKTRPTNTRNAKAVRAYQSMAERSKPVPPPAPRRQKTSNEPTADLLESKELRDIYQLIDDLDYIASKGVAMLNIMKADSFVESLKNAVRLEKSKL